MVESRSSSSRSHRPARCGRRVDADLTARRARHLREQRGDFARHAVPRPTGWSGAARSPSISTGRSLSAARRARDGRRSGAGESSSSRPCTSTCRSSVDGLRRREARARRPREAAGARARRARHHGERRCAGGDRDRDDRESKASIRTPRSARASRSSGPVRPTRSHRSSRGSPRRARRMQRATRSWWTAGSC